MPSRKTEIRNPETYGELPLCDERCGMASDVLVPSGSRATDLPCEALFEEAEWKSVYSVVGKPFPKKGCPKLAEMVRALAQLGGFIDRKQNVRALNLYGWACSVALICPSHGRRSDQILKKFPVAKICRTTRAAGEGDQGSLDLADARPSR